MVLGWDVSGTVELCFEGGLGEGGCMGLGGYGYIEGVREVFG